jgi:hypothetical protein
MSIGIGIANGFGFSFEFINDVPIEMNGGFIACDVIRIMCTFIVVSITIDR